MPIAEGAAFNSFEERKNKGCLENTRVDLLADIDNWGTSLDGKCIFWLNGIAGTGKSTISRTVAGRFSDKKCFGGSFFFKRGHGDRASAKRLFPTLARQLAECIPRMLPLLAEALVKDPELPAKSPKEQFDNLIQKPLANAQEDTGDQGVPKGSIYVVVIDALDECDDSDDIRTILRLFVQFNHFQTLKLRIFLTSRPEMPLRQEIQAMDKSIRRVVLLHDIPTDITAHDIETFFRSEFQQLTTDLSREGSGIELPTDWPGDKAICRLVDMAVPLFIFASTACKFIRDPARHPQTRLQALLDQGHGNSKLDATYRPVLEQTFFDRDEEEQRQWAADFREVVGVIITVFEPSSLSSLASLLRLDKDVVKLRLATLHSVLDIPEHSHDPISLFHLSFHDYLVDQQHCPSLFWIDEPLTHGVIATKCIELMSKNLHYDLCNVEKPGTDRKDVDASEFLSTELLYACRYWVPHLHASKKRIADDDEVHVFMKEKFIYWIEALSWAGCVYDSVTHVVTLISLIKVRRSPRKCEDVNIDKTPKIAL